MDTPDERRLLRALAEKLPAESDFEGLTLVEKAELFRQLRKTSVDVQLTTGRLILAARRDGSSWREIARAFDVRVTTARRWAEYASK